MLSFLKHAIEIISRQLSSKRFFRTHKIFIFYRERKKKFVFYFLPDFFFLSWRPHRCWGPTILKVRNKKKNIFFSHGCHRNFPSFTIRIERLFKLFGWKKSYIRIEEGKKYSVGKSVLSCICWESKMKIIILLRVGLWMELG